MGALTATQEQILERAKELAVEPSLALAIAEQESRFKEWLCKFEPRYDEFYKQEYFAKQLTQSLATEINQQSSSWGIFQLMGGTARALGFEDYIPKLLLVPTNLTYGLLLLRQLQARYTMVTDVMAAYNKGSASKIGAGKFSNQTYVDETFVRYQRWRGALGERN